MKITLFIVITSLLISIKSFSQSKNDTEQWIKNNLEDFKYKEKFQFTEVFFENGNMITHKPIADVMFYNIIPLKEINQIIIQEFGVEDRKGFKIKFFCKSSSTCIIGGTVKNKIRTSDKEPPFEYMTLFLDMSFKNDNMPSRMKKALTHLIKLNGGKLIDDAF